MEERHSKAYAYTILFIATFFWGVQVVPQKFLLAEWSVLTITCIRFFLLSFIIFMWVWWRGGSVIPPKAVWRTLFVMGVLLFFNYFFQVAGVGQTTVTNAALISALNPANTALLAFFLLREKLHPFTWLGIAVSFVGVASVVANGDAAVILEMRLGRGDVSCYIGLVLWGLYSVFAPQAMRFTSAELTTAWTCFIAACFTLPFNFFAGGIHVAPLSPKGWWSFLFLLLLSGVVANVLWNESVKILGPSMVALFSNMTPVIGIAAGYFVMGDELTTAKVVGAAVVLAGMRLATAFKAPPHN